MTFRNPLLPVLVMRGSASTLLFFLIMLLGVATGCAAATGTATANGFWNSSATWLFDSVNRTPTCNDTITIPANRTVTVNSQHNYMGCSQPMVIFVYGVFQFTNGNKIDLPCGSKVYIMNGGVLRKSGSGGGSSTLISICNVVEWKAADGDLFGPDVLGGGTLPVELVAFSAKNESGGVLLSWTTASEVNNDYFTLERSVDGWSFDPFERIPGAGTTSETRHYSRIDAKPKHGVSYYRLKQTDYNGQYSYSDVVAVNRSFRDNLNIYQLSYLATGSWSLCFTYSTEGPVTVRVLDVQGRCVREFLQNAVSGINRLEFGSSDIPAGLHFIQLSDGSSTVSREFISIR